MPLLSIRRLVVGFLYCKPAAMSVKHRALITVSLPRLGDPCEELPLKVHRQHVAREQAAQANHSRLSNSGSSTNVGRARKLAANPNNV